MIIGSFGSREDLLFLQLLQERVSKKGHECVVAITVSEPKLEFHDPVKIMGNLATPFGDNLLKTAHLDLTPTPPRTDYIAGLEQTGILKKAGWNSKGRRFRNTPNTRASRR